MTDIRDHARDRELKKGSAELLILSLLDARPRYGDELACQRRTWDVFVEAVRLVTGDEHA